MRVITHADGTFAGYLPDAEPQPDNKLPHLTIEDGSYAGFDTRPPHVLTVRKTSHGTVMIGITSGDHSVFFAVEPGEVQYELLEVIRDEGPREFVLSY